VSDLSGVYDSTRRDLIELVSGLSEDELDRAVPATPGWTIRNIVAHLAGDASCAIVGDFPSVFFEAFGEPEAVALVNEWTAGQLAKRESKPLPEVLAEWDVSAEKVSSMMRDETPWPDGVPWFVDRVLVTDLAVHQQDIYGAFGTERDREAPQVKIGLAGYIGTMDFRLRSSGGPALRFVSGDKTWLAGGDEADTSVKASRFELFRAMSGRRSPDQIRDLEWDGDPAPFIPYFYPYGVREDALVE
jgi:uncharacterized protein (TIGR03083 family)